ncbi:DUF368 domain-containing protein [Mesonia aestuariivivens]|uniref:DUF368 domain-containing protein n=1 Tax=Mesonia aestuariivivens TaxID=2796128 RepID=A0ABS6W090_9FLAO|nr:DUF368 domain-containing protein [Mesonia aestuariivivens]MBW2961237.1 DUF368 domain-containing protein [Mesonia aestuariivivens]
MQRSFKDYFTIALKGVAMGAADTVPGVSGGTIAFISGIYEELITTIGNIDTSLVKTWKNKGFKAFWSQLNGGFILALMLGIIFSVFTFMRLANYLLKEHPVLIWSFFFGLVVASIWFVAKQIDKWKTVTFITAILGAVIAYLITSLPPATSSDSYFYLLICGAIAVCAMILPGISGAFILVLMGAYRNITQAVHDFDLKKIALVGLGAIIGLLTFSKILKWLFSNYRNTTLAALTGFIAGSLNKIWPWKEILKSTKIEDKVIVLKDKSVLPWNFEGDSHLLFAALLMLAGFFLIIILEKFAEQKPEEDAANPNT